MRRVIIKAEVRRKIGAAGLSRTGLLRLFAWVYFELEHRSPKHNHNRVPGKTDHFLLRKSLLDSGTAYKFAFSVDDQQPNLLVVDDCRHGT